MATIEHDKNKHKKHVVMKFWGAIGGLVLEKITPNAAKNAAIGKGKFCQWLAIFICSRRSRPFCNCSSI